MIAIIRSNGGNMPNNLIDTVNLCFCKGYYHDNEKGMKSRPDMIVIEIDDEENENYRSLIDGIRYERSFGKSQLGESHRAYADKISYIVEMETLTTEKEEISREEALEMFCKRLMMPETTRDFVR